jgi:hypothetical protein
VVEKNKTVGSGVLLHMVHCFRGEVNSLRADTKAAINKKTHYSEAPTEVYATHSEANVGLKHGK